MRNFTLSGHEMVLLSAFDQEGAIGIDTFDPCPEEMPTFKGWLIDIDTNDGTFDKEKGAICDYLINLTSPDGKIYEGRGGYYTNNGHFFYSPVHFSLWIPPLKQETVCPHCGKTL